VKEHWSAGVSPASLFFLRAGRPRSNLKKHLSSSGVAASAMTVNPKFLRSQAKHLLDIRAR
jgi:hypothetical protein